MNWMFPAIAGGVGVLYFGFAFFDIISDWPRYQAKQQKRGVAASRPTMCTAAAIMLLLSFVALHIGFADYRINNTAIQKNVESVNSFVNGTWVFAEPLNSNNTNAKFWYRWVIDKNGTIDLFRAQPASSSWGASSSVKYEVITNKFQDTGTRFFAIHAIGTTLWAIIEDDGALLVRDGDTAVAVLKRGDAFPFSK